MNAAVSCCFAWGKNGATLYIRGTQNKRIDPSWTNKEDPFGELYTGVHFKQKKTKNTQKTKRKKEKRKAKPDARNNALRKQAQITAACTLCIFVHDRESCAKSTAPKIKEKEITLLSKGEMDVYDSTMCVEGSAKLQLNTWFPLSSFKTIKPLLFLPPSLPPPFGASITRAPHIWFTNKQKKGCTKTIELFWKARPRPAMFMKTMSKTSVIPSGKSLSTGQCLGRRSGWRSPSCWRNALDQPACRRLSTPALSSSHNLNRLTNWQPNRPPSPQPAPLMCSLLLSKKLLA